MQFIAPVYGLDDAPVEWHRAISSFIVDQLGHCRCLLEPFWFVRDDDRGRLAGQVLLDVDDFLFGATSSELSQVNAALTDKLVFGKWEVLEANSLGATSDNLTIECW